VQTDFKRGMRYGTSVLPYCKIRWRHFSNSSTHPSTNLPFSFLWRGDTVMVH